MLRLRTAFALALTALVCAAPTANAEPIELEQVYPCLQPYPSASSPLPSSAPIPVRLAVVLHDVDIETARKTMARAEKAYAPLNIDLQPTYLFAHIPERNTDVIFEKLKALFGGKSPAWAHAVVLFSHEDFTSTGPT